MAIGNRPIMVVTVVSKIGRKRWPAVFKITSTLSMPVAKQALIGVNQHNGIINNNTGQSDHARAGHNHRENLAGQNHAEQYADGGQAPRSRGSSMRAIEAVELHQQNNEHQHERGNHGAAKESRRFFGFFIGTAQAPFHA